MVYPLGSSTTMKLTLQLFVLAILLKPTYQGKAGCVKDGSPECPFWGAQGYCTESSMKEYMEQLCCKTCSAAKPTGATTVAEPKCKDTRAIDCPIWAVQGHCTDPAYEIYMKAACCKSCEGKVLKTTLAPCPDGEYRQMSDGKCVKASGALSAVIHFDFKLEVAASKLDAIAVAIAKAVKGAIKIDAIVTVKAEMVAVAGGKYDAKLQFIVKAGSDVEAEELELQLNAAVKTDTVLAAMGVIKDQRVIVTANCGPGMFFAAGKCQKSGKKMRTMLTFKGFKLTPGLSNKASKEFVTKAHIVEAAVMAAIKIKDIAAVAVTAFVDASGAVGAKMDIHVDAKAPIGAVPPKDVEKALKLAAISDPGLKAPELAIDALADIKVADAACMDMRKDCKTYKPLCNDPVFGDLLRGECDKTCGLCMESCKDKREDCQKFKVLCTSPMAVVMKGVCDATCNFCSKPSTTVQPATTKAPCLIPTVGGTAGGACCAFPFTYNGKTYNKCIKESLGKLWCGTTPDGTEWGECKIDKCSLYMYEITEGLTAGECIRAPRVWEAEIVMEGAFSPALAVKTSGEFHMMAAKVVSKVTAALKAKGLVMEAVKVFSFSSGSIKAILLFLTKDLGITPGDIQKALDDLIKNDPSVNSTSTVIDHFGTTTAAPLTSPDATKAPVITTKVPVVTTKAPVVTTKAPVVTTKAPVVTTKAPVVTTQAPCLTKTLGGSCCKFPFTYKGSVYTNCIMADYDKPWCGINSQASEWGICAPRDGNWGKWSPYSFCTRPCGTGVQSRTRACNNPAPARGGKSCQGPPQQDRFCNEKACPIPGNWGPWTTFSSCSKPCGIGMQTRTRKCDSPAPSNGGAKCPGPDKEDTFCQNIPCPIGTWSAWGPYSGCSKPCGGGIQMRFRTCPTEAVGLPCKGEGQETRKCNTQACSGTKPAVTGKWLDWGPCSVPCGGGRQSRIKMCGEKVCDGDDNVETRGCNTNRCPTSMIAPGAGTGTRLGDQGLGRLLPGILQPPVIGGGIGLMGGRGMGVMGMMEPPSPFGIGGGLPIGGIQGIGGGLPIGGIQGIGGGLPIGGIQAIKPKQAGALSDTPTGQGIISLLGSPLATGEAAIAPPMAEGSKAQQPGALSDTPTGKDMISLPGSPLSPGGAELPPPMAEGVKPNQPGALSDTPKAQGMISLAGSPLSSGGAELPPPMAEGVKPNQPGALSDTPKAQDIKSLTGSPMGSGDSDSNAPPLPIGYRPENPAALSDTPQGNSDQSDGINSRSFKQILDQLDRLKKSYDTPPVN